MLDALRFVQGAVSKKDIVTELTHFKIHMGRVSSYNGRVTLSSPIGLDIDCCPKALDMVKAIAACQETVQLHLTPQGKLAVRSGSFRTHIETIPEAFTGVEPEGIPVSIDGNLLPVLKTLNDVTSEDASRPWANGILLDGHSAYATNNVVVVEYWLGYHFPYRANIPSFAIKELLRIKEEPTGLLLTDKTATFLFEGDRYLKTQLLSADWPDIAALLELIPPTNTPVPGTFFADLEKMRKFVDETQRVHLLPGAIATSLDPDTGTTIEMPGLNCTADFSLPMLQILEGLAERIGFEEYPRPCPFYGKRIRGLIAGMRPIGYIAQ